ncbi:MAG: hypothetical protein ACRDN8_13380 [Thermoleophilaceae bacterium]
MAQELYGVPPEEFVAARDEHVRQAKAAGDRELATRLGRLRRPTQSAWLVNLLWRQRRELVEELLALGDAFRGEDLTRERLHELSTRRRELLHRLQTEAQQLSADAGVQLTADRAREVEATLAAALADPDAADQVRGSRLVTALSYSGLGPELQLLPGAPSDPSRMRNFPARTGTAEALTEPDTASDARAADPSAAEAKAAEAGVAEAKAAAERMVYQRTEALEDAVRRRDELARRRDELRVELRLAQQRLDRVEDELTDAEHATQHCADSLEQAKQALARL